MSNPPEDAGDQFSPQGRIRTELIKLESQQKELWVIVAFAGVVLFLGVLSLLFPKSFWHAGALQISLSPEIFFVIMVGMVLAALFYVRHSLEVKGLRLAGLQQVLSHQAEGTRGMIDVVTNVYTRNLLHDLLQTEISRAERTKRELALLMCDLNNFKQVNDRYGHLMGDFVLSQIAAILKSCVRGSDYVVRFGGDEFLLVLPETDSKGGEIVQQRIHHKVMEWDRRNRMGDLPISVSLGLYLHVPGQTAEKDVAEADARMYAEKRVTNHGAILTAAPSIES
jgi:diguanylate cyclase (GGDEF)-like protein